MTMTELDIFVVGLSGSSFTVEIQSSKKVNLLKKAIKKEKEHGLKKRNGLNPFDADELTLYRVELQTGVIEGKDLAQRAHEALEKLKEDAISKNETAELDSAALLSKYFDDEYWKTAKKTEMVHVLVEMPRNDAIPIPTSPPPVHEEEIDQLPELERLRKSYLQGFPYKAPSTLGEPSEIKRLQTSTRREGFRCDRPPSSCPAVPITLLHPEFNLFLQDCEHHRPSKEDHAFALKVSREMSEFYPSELERRTKFIAACEDYNIFFIPSTISRTRYITDGDIQCNGCMCNLLEAKLEMGAKGAEPVFQGGIYYTNKQRAHPDRLKLDTPFPCIGIYLIGSTLGFVGFVFTDRTHIQVLGPALRLDYHYTDVKLRRMTARYLGAFRRSTERLKHYYETEYPKLKSLDHQSRSDPRLPCYFKYSCLVSPSAEECEIAYTCQPHPSKLVFFGKVKTTDVCVKFATRYSKEAHFTCASLKCAPKLLGFEELPGGWYMVVMERIDGEYHALDDAILNGASLDDGLEESISHCLTNLHQAGSVHGDLRAGNIMVRKDGMKGFMFLDFDWAGRIGEVCYPMNVNSGPHLWRPEGAVDEELIKAEHDVEMLSNIFNSIP